MRKIIVAVENEPYPKSPIGISAGIKLADWLDLAEELKNGYDIEIIQINDLEGKKPNIVEAFATRADILNKDTFPTYIEHEILTDIRKYWPAVEKSKVPCIPIFSEGYKPKKFPVFVRGPNASFKSGGRVNSMKEFNQISATDLVVRPFVEIMSCVARKSVTKELRVHVICGKCASVEFLFPSWASSKPTQEELNTGREWAKSLAGNVTAWSEEISKHLDCKWFSADFCETDNGPMLIELNPGWCSGVTHESTARSVHSAILLREFEIPLQGKFNIAPPGL